MRFIALFPLHYNDSINILYYYIALRNAVAIIYYYKTILVSYNILFLGLLNYFLMIVIRSATMSLDSILPTSPPKRGDQFVVGVLYNKGLRVFLSEQTACSRAESTVPVTVSILRTTPVRSAPVR